MSPKAALSLHSPSVSDLAVVATITKWIPLEVVEDALQQANCETYRLRSLPSDLMVYFAVLMGLHKELSASEVLRILLTGIDEIYGKRGAKIPTRSGINQARVKIGSESLKLTFQAICKPIAQPGSVGSFFHTLRMVALDGCLMNVADSKKNDEEFGRPTNQSKKSGSYPQVRMVCLAECGTHAIFKVALGSYFTGEITLARSLISSLQPDMLCLADRLFFGYALWRQASDSGAALLWRVKANVRLKPQKTLSDGSYIALYYPSDRDKENSNESPITLRVVEYEVVKAKSSERETIRLVTNILDQEKAPAQELAKLYMQRWEIEITYGEVKVRLNHNQVCLRSGTPDLVKQEIYGLLLAHFCVRSSIYEAASKRKKNPDDPDNFSFTAAVRIIRRHLPGSGDFPP